MVRRKRWFDDFFKEFEEMERMIERMFKEAWTSEEPLFYGFSVSLGPGGEPEIKTFGNVKTTPTGELVKGAREPFAEVMTDKDKKELIITAEMPGVSKEDIKVNVYDNTIEISAKVKKEEKEEREGYIRRERRAGRFYRAISLPCEVDAKKAKATYKNGILEVRLPKVALEKGTYIKVE